MAVEALGRPTTFVQALHGVRDGGKAVMVGIAPTGTTAPVPITHLVRRSVSGQCTAKGQPGMVWYACGKRIRHQANRHQYQVNAAVIRQAHANVVGMLQRSDELAQKGS